MTDIERLKRSGYGLAGVDKDKYGNPFAVYLKKTRKHELAIHEFGDRSTFIVLDGEERHGDIVGTVKRAIAFGEKYLAQMASERRTARAAPE